MKLNSKQEFSFSARNGILRRRASLRLVKGREGKTTCRRHDGQRAHAVGRDAHRRELRAARVAEGLLHP